MSLLIKYPGKAIIGLICVIPIFLWFPYSNFETAGSAFLSTGQAAGIVGSVLFSVNFLLSARFKFLEPVFGGLNEVYKAHHTVGRYALLFLIAHPAALAVYYLPDKLLRAMYLPLPSNIAVLMGHIAFDSFVVLLILTLYIKLKYDTWKKTHKFLGVPLFFASLHIYLIPSTTTVLPQLKYYLLLLALAGLCAYSYRVLFGRFFVKRHLFAVSYVKKLNSKVTQIRLVPKNKLIKYSPGQFIFISFFVNNAWQEVHPFSITSTPANDYIELTIKASGDYTSTIKNLTKGVRAKIEGPFGYFSYCRYSNRRQIWIAGGIGVTPFISMARSLTTPNPYKIDMYYLVGTKDEAVYQDELEKIAGKISGFKLFTHFSKTSGRFSAEILSKTSADFAESDIFICGPQKMMKSLADQLIKLGVKKYAIHSEEFSIG